MPVQRVTLEILLTRACSKIGGPQITLNLLWFESSMSGLTPMMAPRGLMAKGNVGTMVECKGAGKASRVVWSEGFPQV